MLTSIGINSTDRSESRVLSHTPLRKRVMPTGIHVIEGTGSTPMLANRVDLWLTELLWSRLQLTYRRDLRGRKYLDPHTGVDSELRSTEWSSGKAILRDFMTESYIRSNRMGHTSKQGSSHERLKDTNINAA